MKILYVNPGWTKITSIDVINESEAGFVFQMILEEEPPETVEEGISYVWTFDIDRDVSTGYPYYNDIGSDFHTRISYHDGRWYGKIDSINYPTEVEEPDFSMNGNILQIEIPKEDIEYVDGFYLVAHVSYSQTYPSGYPSTGHICYGECCNADGNCPGCTDTCSPEESRRCSVIYNAYDWCIDTNDDGCNEWALLEYCNPGQECVDGECVNVINCSYHEIKDIPHDIDSGYPGHLDILQAGIVDLNPTQYLFYVYVRDNVENAEESFTYKWIIDHDMNSSTGELNYYNSQYIGNEYNIKMNYYSPGDLWFMSIDTLGELNGISIDPAENEFTVDKFYASFVVDKEQVGDIDTFDWAFEVETSMKPNDKTDVVRFSSENTENC